MNCTCEEYPDLELDRDAITKRARVAKRMKKRLNHVAENRDREHHLYDCPGCGSKWQSASAWNWGAREYLFRVPDLPITQWEQQPFADPDEILIFAAMVDLYFERTGPVELTASSCREVGCEQRAMSGSVFCLLHHLESLQQIHQFPKLPSGRLFGPYQNFTREYFEQYVQKVATGA